MSIKKLTLTNFRNHKHLEIHSDAPFILIEGLNGTGKTNILEAISFLSPGRGFLNSSSQDMIPLHLTQTSDANWQINAIIESNDNSYNIGTGYFSANGNSRIIKVNETLLSKQVELLDYLRIVWVIPQIDNIFSESTSSKRKFFDRICLNFYPSHAQSVFRYEQTMRSRNKILSTRNYDVSWLNSIENIMTIESINIAKVRLEVLKLLTQELEKFQTMFIKPEINIKGFIEEQLNIKPAHIIKELLSEKFVGSRLIDARLKKTTLGAHTSFLEVLHPEKKLSVHYCSTGEKKAMLIALMVAQIMAIKSTFSGTVIVLLDDIFSHLDRQYRAEFIKELNNLNIQTWITSTEIDVSTIGCKDYIKINT